MRQVRPTAANLIATPPLFIHLYVLVWPCPMHATSAGKMITITIEQRIIVKFLRKLGKNATETYHLLRKVYGKESLSRARVFEWFRRFHDGREDVEDNIRPGRPSTSTTAENIEKIHMLIQSDSGLTIRAIAQTVGIDKECVRQIILNKKLCKLRERSTPKVMSQVIHNTPTPQLLTASASMPINQFQSATSQMQNIAILKQTFKEETPLDILDDSAAEDQSPKIRLTPTSKLMASPNPTDPKRKFVCPYENCTKSYGKSSHLRSHLTWHTGIKPFVCSEPMCGKGFTRSDELNRHIRTHTGEKPFECTLCIKKFSRSDHLTKHLATHERQMKSPIKRQATAAYLKLKSKKLKSNDAEPPEPCIQLEEGVHFTSVLDERPQEHSGLQDNSLVETILPDEGLTNKEMLTQDNSIPQPIKIKLEKPEHSDFYHVVPPLPPPTLDQSASEYYNVYGTRALQQVKNEPLFDAELIPQLPPPDGPNTYGMPQFIQSTEDRPYHCRECMKRFKRQDDLNRHIRTHTGEKPFACTQCERRFMRSDHLRKHQQTHFKAR